MTPGPSRWNATSAPSWTVSGQMYRVLPGYDFYSEVWLPAETIIICQDALVWFEGEPRMINAIVNKNENNEHVSAFKGR